MKTLSTELVELSRKAGYTLSFERALSRGYFSDLVKEGDETLVMLKDGTSLSFNSNKITVEEI